MSRHSRARVPSAPEISTIEDLSHEGRGVTHSGGKVVFADTVFETEAARKAIMKKVENQGYRELLIDL